MQAPINQGDSPRVSVVLPCLNEAGSVGLVVRQALDAFDAIGVAGEVVVADNGSTDGSQQIATEAGARVVTQPVRGYGAALMAGITAARGEVVVMADADATYPFDRLGDLIGPVMRGEADMVLGNRWCGATAQTMPFLHRFVGTPLLTWLVRRAGGPAGLTDSQSGFRAFRRTALDDLGLRSAGMEFASEMLIVAGRAEWRILEIEAGYHERIGESKLDTFNDGWRHLKTILMLAPDLLAIYPGAAFLTGGLLLSGLAFIPRDGLRLGSPIWQLSLLAPVLVIIGAQALLAGLVLTARSPLRARSSRIPTGELLRSAAAVGAWLAGVGVAIHAALFVAWSLDLGVPMRGLQLAGLAQSMLVIGLTVLGFTIIAAVTVAGQDRWQDPAARVRSDSPRSHERPSPVEQR